MKRLPYLLSMMMLLGALGHIFAAAYYAPLIPDFIPEWFAHAFSIVAEGGLGIALLMPKYCKWGGLGFMVLMLVFLPLHMWDATKDVPAMGSQVAAIFRLVIQFVLIYMGYLVYKK